VDSSIPSFFLKFFLSLRERPTPFFLVVAVSCCLGLDIMFICLMGDVAESMELSDAEAATVPGVPVRESLLDFVVACGDVLMVVVVLLPATMFMHTFVSDSNQIGRKPQPVITERLQQQSPREPLSKKCSQSQLNKV